MKVIAGTLPKYRQLLQLLRSQILGGELAPGARLPTEEVLIERYELSCGTVRKAIEQLAAEGLVYIVQGSGTYVSAAHPNAVPFRFTDCTPGGAAVFRVITKEIIPASMAIAERLALPPGEPVIHMTALAPAWRADQRLLRALPAAVTLSRPARRKPGTDFYP